MKKISIKRGQSQAGLSFAERKNFRPKVKRTRLLLLLALLMTAATGAWAQTETLLTTITPTGDASYDETTPGVVTVTHDNNDFSKDYGWLWDSQSGSVTVEAKEGYTITRCVFKQNSKTPVTITTSPFKITFGDDGTCEQCDEFMDGVTSIEVYGYAPAPAASTYSVTLAEGTEDGDNWKISPTEAAEGAKVTVTYSGDRKVKSVKAVKKAAAAPITLDNTITAWTAGSYAVPAGGLTYSDAITVSGNVTLTLTDGETLTLNKGISLASGATLTVEGNGTMNVNGTNENTTSTVAGSTGTLILTSGTLTATGGNGLGVDEDEMLTDNRAYAGGNAINGNVTVSGGTLTAIGGNGGSIGNYSESAYGADGGVAISGSVTVTDGTVTATGGNGGSIGADAPGAKGGSGGAAIGGDATVNGGTWTASNGTNGGGGGGAGGKAVAGTAPAVGTDLATITADYEAKDGETLTGTLASNVKISIAAGANVTLKDVTINGVDNYSYKWAGITCAGDATITLEGTNTLKGFDQDYPGIQVPMDKTLTIQGTGSLNARSNGYAAGIGGGYQIACGNIVINSGTVEATGGDLAAGIGGGNRASCGNITINGGTVEATGGSNAAGIGGGSKNGACGTITITSGVTSVTATKGANATYSIGKGNGGQDITVNIEAGANVTQK